MANRGIFKFKYPKVVANHYRYSAEMDKHNSLRNDGGTKSQFGLESIFGTTWWPILVFAFFISRTEVNSYL